LSSLQKLLQRGSVSEAEVEAGAQRLKAADAALQSLNERIHNRYSPADIASWKAKVSADRATIAAERVSYSNANISSPINGTVYIIPVTVYDFVPAGAELLHVADLSQLEVSAPFSEPDIGKLYQNQPVRITWDGNAGLTWSGHIVTRPLAVTRSGASGTGVCIIALDDVKDDLPVNSTVAATVVTGKHSHALTIPRAALYSRGGSYFVYRITGGHLVETPVEIGVLNAFRVEITRGLSIKDVLALRAADDEPLSNNRRVTTIQ
jgi:HlyD family secretion protein